MVMPRAFLGISCLLLLVGCGGGPGPQVQPPAVVLAAPQVKVVPATLPAGDVATLTWTAEGASALTLEPGFGNLAGNSAVFLAPTRTTRYTLRAQHAEGLRETSFDVVVSGTATAPTVQRQELLEDLRALSNPAMEGRKVGTTGGARARAWLIQRLAALGLTAQEEAWSLSGRMGANVLVRIPGTLGAGPVLLACAHYDHIGLDRAGAVVAGADDNASGSAALLQLARDLQSRAPRHDVLLAWWDGEEAGLLGAEAYARKPHVPLDRLHAVLNLDMISRADFGKLGVIGTDVWPGIRTAVDAAARAHGLVPDYGWERYMPYSDQYVFHRQGVRTIFLCDVEHPDYHTVRDTYERIQPRFFIQATETALALLRALDGLDVLPPRVTTLEPPPALSVWQELPWLQPEGRVR